MSATKQYTPRMAGPGRNDPCPCGSGKKYKRCCAAKGSVAAPLDVAAALHGIDGDLVARILHMGRTLAPECFAAALDDCPCDPDAEGMAQIVAPYLAYIARVDGRPLVEKFMEREGARLDVRERDWLEANRSARLSVWEVVEVFPERALHLRDLLTGEERGVTERTGTRGLSPRMALCARVVTAGGVSLMVGSHPRPLGPLETEDVVAHARGFLGSMDGPVPEDEFRKDLPEVLLDEWQRAADALDTRPPPRLTNTDGDALEDTEDRFELKPGARRKVEAALARIEGFRVEALPAHDDPGATEFRVFRASPSAGAPLGNLGLGSVHLTGSRLTVKTNSERRADDLRRRIEAACGGRVVHRERLRRDMQDLLAPAAGRDLPAKKAPADLPPEIAEGLILDFKRRHYAAWPDLPIPVLAGKTPREAASDKRARRKLIALMKDIELRESTAPPGQRYDVGDLRQALGLLNE